jgi:hypothetical protein
MCKSFSKAGLSLALPFPSVVQPEIVSLEAIIMTSGRAGGMKNSEPLKAD